MFVFSLSTLLDVEESCREHGHVLGPDRKLQEEVTIELHDETSVLVRSKDGNESMILSLFTGSTFPGEKPADIIGRCEGYGMKKTVAEWLRPSTFIGARLERAK